MYYISCLFDHNVQPPKPLIAAVYDADEKRVDIYDLYLKGTGTNLYDVEENKKAIKTILEGYETTVSDFKSFIGAFDLDVYSEYQVYEKPTAQIRIESDDYETLKKLLLLEVKEISSGSSGWGKILADSQLVYRYLETTGYYNEGKKCSPVYRFAYTGRSISTKHNIQGTSVKDDIKHTSMSFDTFICFDWKAADIRVASLLCKDKRLQQAFIDSDPYTALHEELGDADITREDCKIALFRSLYSLDYDNPILECYDDFPKWMKDSVKDIDDNGFSTSILGRKFFGTEGRTRKSVFNAQMQGSVAHAMQCVLYRVFKVYPVNLMADIHDSLVLASRESDVEEIIETVSAIMLHPFEGVLKSNPAFPLKVHVGKQWKQWKEVKEIKYGQEERI